MLAGSNECLVSDPSCYMGHDGWSAKLVFLASISPRPSCPKLETIQDLVSFCLVAASRLDYGVRIVVFGFTKDGFGGFCEIGMADDMAKQAAASAYLSDCEEVSMVLMCDDASLSDESSDIMSSSIAEMSRLSIRVRHAVVIGNLWIATFKKS